MIITEHNKPINQEALTHNDDSDLHNDELGENSGDDTGLAKAYKEEQEKKKDSSGKAKGPAEENLQSQRRKINFRLWLSFPFRGLGG